MKWEFLHCKYGFNRLFYTLWYHYHGSKVIEECKRDYIQKHVLVKLPDDLMDEHAILKHVDDYFERFDVSDQISMSLLLIYAMKFKRYHVVRKMVGLGRPLMLNCTEHDLQIALAEATHIKTLYTTCDKFTSRHYPLQIAAADDQYSLEDLQNMVNVGADVDTVFKASIIDWSFGVEYYDCKACLDKFIMLGANVHKIDMVQDLYSYIRDDTGDQLTAITQFHYLISKGADPTLLLNLLIECKPYCEGPFYEHRCEVSMLLSKGANINYNNGHWLMTYIVDPWEKTDMLESGEVTTLENMIKYYGMDVNVLEGMALAIAVSSFIQLGSTISKHKTNVRDWMEETDRSRILLRAIQALLSKCPKHVIESVLRNMMMLRCAHQAEKIQRQVMLYVFKNAI